MAKRYQVGGHGQTGAIATGTAVAHGCGATPGAVIILSASTGATDVFVDTVGGTNFVVHFGGGGTHVFNWIAVI
jgi:hypothetical protein